MCSYRSNVSINDILVKVLRGSWKQTGREEVWKGIFWEVQMKAVVKTRCIWGRPLMLLKRNTCPLMHLCSNSALTCPSHALQMNLCPLMPLSCTSGRSGICQNYCNYYKQQLYHGSRKPMVIDTLTVFCLITICDICIMQKKYLTFSILLKMVLCL